jgi:uncharacterized membrane protein
MEASATLIVRAPVERVFEFWNDYQNFPRFMSHVCQVYKSGENRSHWKVAGPGGLPVEFDTVITECEPNRQIAWKSLNDSPIETSGHVHFEARSDRSTWVGVCIRYTPPAGPLGRAVVGLFGPDPQQMLEHDLAEMAALIEDAQPHKEGRTEPIERWEDESPQAREEP